jgi:deoxyribodipyrimidine photo-lyase
MREPVSRIRAANLAAPRARGRFVLYWMIAARRAGYNFGLQRAVGWARRLGKPLVVLEALRSDYPWASARLSGFVADGMRENARAFARRPLVYHPYVEPERGAGKGLLQALAAEAAVVVTDDFPAFFLPRMIARAAAQLDVLVEAVDSNGLLPMRAAPATFSTALAFRRFLQGELARYLSIRPLADPLDDEPLPVPEPLPAAITRRGRPRPRRCSPATRARSPRCRWIRRWRGWPPAAALARRGRCSPPSSRSGWPATPRSAATPTRTRRAGCRPTCTSATSRCTRCSTSWARARAGARRAWAAGATASARASGA